MNNFKNIVFVSDANQVDYALTNALMILSQTNEKNIKIYLILSDIEESKRKWIGNIKKKFALDAIQIIYFDSDKFELGVSKLDHITVAANIRLYLGSILSELDNVLYLDNDTVVVGEINDLFDFVDENKSYGQPWTKWDLWPVILRMRGLFKNKYYVNSGVIYLDLKNIRNNNLEENFIDFLKNKKEKLLFVDQDILNCIINFEPLPYVWNIARDKWQKHNKEISSKSSLRIYHFLSKEKQWGESFDKIKKVKKGGLTKKEMNRLVEPQKKWVEFYKKIQELEFNIQD